MSVSVAFDAILGIAFPQSVAEALALLAAHAGALVTRCERPGRGITMFHTLKRISGSSAA